MVSCLCSSTLGPSEKGSALIGKNIQSWKSRTQLSPLAEIAKNTIECLFRYQISEDICRLLFFFKQTMAWLRFVMVALPGLFFYLFIGRSLYVKLKD